MRIFARVLAAALLASAPLLASPALAAAEATPDPSRAVEPSGSAAEPALTVTEAGTGDGRSFEVSASGCDDDFQYAEVRLVVGLGHEPMNALMTGVGADPSVVEVPEWVEPGPARFEGSCLEPNFSRASDGADILDFVYPAVPVAVDAPAPAPRSGALTVNRIVRDGNLTVSGADCSGRVLVTTDRGSDLVTSATDLHYGRTLVTAEPDGTWTATIPLTYSVGEYSDPVAPGPMAVFAVCEGTWYQPAHIWVSSSSPAPAVGLVTGNPSQIYLAQCPSGNSLLIATVSRVGWRFHVSVTGAQGHEYGERFQDVEVPEGATSVSYLALCTGRAAPPFLYRSASWRA